MLKKIWGKKTRGKRLCVLKVKIESVWECWRGTLNGRAVSIFPQLHRPKTAKTPVNVFQRLWRAVPTNRMTCSPQSGEK